MDRDTIDRYFAILEDVLRDNSLIDKSRQIYNCDESGMPLCPSSPKIVCEKGEKNPSTVTSDTKTQVTMLACVSAAGECMPPMVIFDRKKKLKPCDN